MPRTPTVAPEFTGAKDAGELTQQPAINLNPGQERQPDVELVPAYTPKDVASEAFWSERLVIQVHEQQDVPLHGVMLNHNGEDCAVPFGRPVELKRKFVQLLLDMRKTNFTQPKRNPFQVENGNAMIPKTTLLYPFAVMRDPNPNGGHWLQTEQMRNVNIAGSLR